MQQQNILSPVSEKQGFNWNDFLSFRTIITLKIIQIVYLIGAVLVTLGGLGMLFAGNSGYGSILPSGPLMGLLTIVIGNVFWRMWCELIIVLFRINKTLTNIEDNTRS